MACADGQRARWTTGRIVASRPVSEHLLVFDVELPKPLTFEPGQFAMLNLTGPGRLVFGRPFSILAADGARVSFLYRVVGKGTGRLASATPGTPLQCFGPLGQPFPALQPDEPAVLIAGGVGLPPLWAWRRRHGRPGDLACFGAVTAADVPWDLLDDGWRVSVDEPGAPAAGRAFFHGRVVALAEAELAAAPRPAPRILACGPLPMLRAAVELAAARGWPCLVSVEERMGCGYGVCRGCAVPRRGGGYLTACVDGPVLDAERVDWERFGRTSVEAVAGEKR